MKRDIGVALIALGLPLGAGDVAAQQAQRIHGPGHLGFEGMDTDHDGTTSLAGFKAAHEPKLEAHFARKDADGGGVLSKEELANWRAHERGHRRQRDCDAAQP